MPDVLIPAHSAALGITFYTGEQFPQRYRNGAFVALHGSWNRSVAAGYKVVFFPMTNGKPGPIEDFLTGMLSSTGANGTPIKHGAARSASPSARDGSLLVSDDGGEPDLEDLSENGERTTFISCEEPRCAQPCSP